MFRRQSPPLLFVFNKEKKLTIHSLFCRTFKAVWLNEKKQATKTQVVYPWKIGVSGKGKYLLEIPCRRELPQNDILSTGIRRKV